MAQDINSAAEARQVEKEFHLAKSYAMHKPSPKIDISKEKLTKHFEKHFSERDLELPPELANPNNFEYLKDSPIKVNEEPPSLEEFKRHLKHSKIINLLVLIMYHLRESSTAQVNTFLYI